MASVQYSTIGGLEEDEELGGIGGNRGGYRTGDVGGFGGGKPDEFIADAEEQIRAGFVRKIFGILAVQLAVTFGIIAIFSQVKPVHDYVTVNQENGKEPHIWPFTLSVVISFACLITLACCSNQARIYPNNYVFLGIFTVAEGVMLGVLCAGLEVMAVMIAVGITAAVVSGLIAFAMYTKRDLTGFVTFFFPPASALLRWSVGGGD